MVTKKWIKTAMVLFILSSSMTSGLMAMLIKLAGTLLFHYELYEMAAAQTILLILCGLFCINQVYTLNIAMKYYDQMEVIPIFQTSVMIFWILTGLVLLDEHQFYSAGQLWSTVAAVVICCIGVKFLTMKKTFIKREVIYEDKPTHGYHTA